ncbi:MAG: ferredoxin [Bacteroidetes bacterium]|nr:ferredoxin [Bacteroidota bacterium]
MFRIIFFRGKCIGCNGCVEAAPDRWRISRKDGRCNLVGGKQKKNTYQTIVSMEEYEQNEKAATNCPVKIIRLEVL